MGKSQNRLGLSSRFSLFYVSILVGLVAVSCASKQIQNNFPLMQCDSKVLIIFQLKDIKIDSMHTLVEYDLVFRKNPKLEEKDFTKMQLQIGDKYTLFANKYELEVDSIHRYYKQFKGLTENHKDEKSDAINTADKKNNFSIKMIHEIDKPELTIFGNIDLHNSTTISSREDNVVYSIPTPSLSWVLHKEEKTIMEHKVYKATTNYAGRDWVAWYTEEVNLAYGPYVFQGLDGLILELYDTEDNFRFSASSIQKTKAIIYNTTVDPEQKEYENRGNFRNTTEEAFFKERQLLHNKPRYFDLFTSFSQIPLPFNPIER